MGKRVFTEKVITDDILGTNGYHPPEVLLEEEYDFRADVFMLGVTFCVMVSIFSGHFAMLCFIKVCFAQFAQNSFHPDQCILSSLDTDSFHSTDFLIYQFSRYRIHRNKRPQALRKLFRLIKSRFLIIS